MWCINELKSLYLYKIFYCKEMVFSPTSASATIIITSVGVSKI